MKIIHPGKLPGDQRPQSWRGQCNKCGCVFVMTAADGTVTSFAGKEITQCPTAGCGETVILKRIVYRGQGPSEKIET